MLDSPLQPLLHSALAEVESLFERQLRSDLPAVARLCRHIESYRGKMLRPTLVLVSGLASDPSCLPPAHLKAAAVVEMIHMATLVHDDVLDESSTRRRADTVNRLHGNETAVILGDYLIASAYHLCSQLGSSEVSLLVAHTSMTLCAGELLQLSHQGDFSLDEPTYFQIIERKTAALIALSCRLGAICSGADEPTTAGLHRFGTKIGLAFQIQDDLLDLTGRPSALGKPVGQDLARAKLTLPVIHHLAHIPARERGRSLELLEQACATGSFDRATGGLSGAAAPASARATSDATSALLRALTASNSLAHARSHAERLIAEAKHDLAPLPPSPAKDLLLSMANTVLSRSS